MLMWKGYNEKRSLSNVLQIHFLKHYFILIKSNNFIFILRKKYYIWVEWYFLKEFFPQEIPKPRRGRVTQVPQPPSPVQKDKWQWGGCSDNVRFGLQKSREFMDSRYRKKSDIKTLIKLHNHNAGRLVSKMFFNFIWTFLTIVNIQNIVGWQIPVFYLFITSLQLLQTF